MCDSRSEDKVANNVTTIKLILDPEPGPTVHLLGRGSKCSFCAACADARSGSSGDRFFGHLWSGLLPDGQGEQLPLWIQTSPSEDGELLEVLHKACSNLRAGSMGQGFCHERLLFNPPGDPDRWPSTSGVPRRRRPSVGVCNKCAAARRSAGRLYYCEHCKKVVKAVRAEAECENPQPVQVS